MLPDGYIVLFNTKTEWVHTLNPCGALVWEFCDGSHLPDEIAAEIAALTGCANPAALQTEITVLINTLIEQGMLLHRQP
ncbi:MAG: PqqD family protein [Candidatus Saccharimonadales bacterium]